MIGRLRLVVVALVAAMTACATSPVQVRTAPGSGSPLPTPTVSSAPAEPVSASPLPTISPTPSAPETPAEPRCADLAAGLPLRQQVGQLFMIAVEPGANPQRVVSAGVGSVLLLGDWPSRTTTAAQVEAMTRAVPGLLVATDQEGGRVQRLKGSGFDTIPNAVAQAEMGDEALRAAAARWAIQLWAAGVRYNLAPVADVVPASKVTSNQPIGALKRGYGSDPDDVGALVAAFVAGMESADIATSLKHFPGLGEVTGNTDFTSATDTVTTRTSPSLAAFQAGIDAGASSVMVSSAVYAKIDPGVPAVFSTVIVTGMLRGDLGFAGVIISDDLGAAKSVAGVPPGDRAVRFFAAGGDLLINADASLQGAMTEAVMARASTDPSFARQVTASAGRVLALKASVGIGRCGS